MALITNILAMVVMISSVIWQEDIGSGDYLGVTGLIIFLANGITMGLLCSRREAESDGVCNKKVVAFAQGFCYSFFPRLFCLAAGEYP